MYKNDYVTYLFLSPLLDVQWIFKNDISELFSM